jgi:hypothetical protein
MYQSSLISDPLAHARRRSPSKTAAYILSEQSKPALTATPLMKESVKDEDVLISVKRNPADMYAKALNDVVVHQHP